MLRQIFTLFGAKNFKSSKMTYETLIGHFLLDFIGAMKSISQSPQFHVPHPFVHDFDC